MDAPAIVVDVPLDRITALDMDSGARVTLYGRIVTSLDGTSFEAPQTFDLAAGGLEVVARNGADAAYEVRADGSPAPACAAAGVAAPCLVPRLTALAHERLRTTGEFASTLSGAVHLESVAGQAAAPGHAGARVLMALGVMALGFGAMVIVRRLARSALGRIWFAARRARRALRGDVTLAPARSAVDAMVLRARSLDATCRACTRKLSGIDRAALERRAEAWGRSMVPGSSAALESLRSERDELASLERARASAAMQLERIESALRVVALRSGGSRPHDGLACVDPVATLVGELDLRDRSIAEADGQ